MSKKSYWQRLSSAQRQSMASGVQTSVGYLRQVFMYDRQCGAKKARAISEWTGGQVGPHELCPGVFSAGDDLAQSA